MLKKIHKGCGGEVKDRKCLKCGKVWSKFKYFLASDIEEKQEKFDEKEYKKRIKEGRDIFK